MEDLKYFVAIIIVVVVGFILIKRISSCLWNIIVGFIMMAVLAWALAELGML